MGVLEDLPRLLADCNIALANEFLSASVVMHSGGAGTDLGKPCSSGKLSTLTLCSVSLVDELISSSMHDAGTVTPVPSFKSEREPLRNTHDPLLNNPDKIAA